MLKLAVLVCVVGMTLGAECPTLPSNYPCTCSVLDGQQIQPLEIDCEDKDLNQIPDLSAFRGKPIHYLSLAQNEISSLPARALDGLVFNSASFLRQDSFIDLDQNPLSSISQDAFTGMSADAVGLRLGGCSLDDIPNNTFQKMSNWTFLFLGDNNINNVQGNQFKDLPKLRHLDLSNNPIKKLNREVFTGLENVLENLNLKKTHLTEVPTAAIEILHKLNQLSLASTKIEHIQAEAFGKLKTEKPLELIIRRMDLKTIHKDAFKGAKFMLKTFKLDENDLADVSFLSDYCNSVFNKKPTISVLDNDINCDCDLYEAVKSKRFTLQGTCENPNTLKGTDIAKAFMEKGKGMCMGKIEDNVSCENKSPSSQSDATIKNLSLTLVMASGLLYVFH